MGIALLSRIAKRAGHKTSFFDLSDYIHETKGDASGVELLLFKRYKFPVHLKFIPSLTLQEGIKKAVREFKPNLLAVSVTYLIFKNSLQIVRQIRDEQKIPTIFGGIHVTLNPDDVISHPEVDMICRGEGELAFEELLDKMEGGEDITQIPNIWVKIGGKVIKNTMRPMRDSLEDIPLCDWSIYPEHHFYKPYVGKIYRAGDIIISRGCYNSCAYCYYHAYYKAYGQKKHTVVFMSPERAMQEIYNICKNYGVRLIKLRDADFAARPYDSMHEMVRLFNEMDTGIRPKLLCNVHHLSVTKEKIKLMKEMNMVSISMGLESGSYELRSKYLNRKGSTKKFLDACRWIRESGIRLTTSNMIGIPFETRKEIFETIEVNRKAKVDLADVSILYPFPGTQINQTCKDLGFLKKELSEQEYHRGEPVLDMPQISREELWGLMRTFQIYYHAPKWFYLFIRRAEKDGEYRKFLDRCFYPYIFYAKPPFVKLSKMWTRRAGRFGSD